MNRRHGSFMLQPDAMSTTGYSPISHPADLFAIALLLYAIWTCSWRTAIDLNVNTPDADRLLSQALSLSVQTRRPSAQGSI